MNSEQSNKERIKFQSYQEQRNKNEKEELINPQIDKSKHENNINEENNPICNYPYEFYEDDKNKKEEIKIDNQPREIKLQEQKEILKEDQNIKKIIPENKKNIETINKQINKNESFQKAEENLIIKEEQMSVEKIVNAGKLRNSPRKDEKMKVIILKNMDKKKINPPPPPKEEYIPPKVKEIKMIKEAKENKKISEKKNSNPHQKTKFTQKTENDYYLMMKQLKNKDYKYADDRFINNMVNSDEKNLKKNKNIPKNLNNKELIDDFLQRNQDDIKYRQNNNKTINERLKVADENAKKRVYFNNKEDEQIYFDDFYNHQIEFINNCQSNIDKLSQQIKQEKEKNYIPEPKIKTNLNYFKNKNSVELSKFKAEKKIKEENKKVNENEKNSTPKIKTKKTINNKSNIANKNNNNKVKDSKNDNISNKNKPKLTKKEIDELTNKLHYEGELLKVKKQTMISEEFANNPNYHNFSKDKLSKSSIIILIKKLLYEYSTSVKNNTYIDCIKNPKLNYEQYIDILKDLYYLERDALPEDYLEDDTMYKELWDKLTKFSKGPENSLESNILLLYFLELNGFFRNEKLIKGLETEIHWIKLDNYEELIANAKYIEENWDDLKLKKAENIKRLKSLKQYNPIHNEDIYNSNTVNCNKNLNNNSINVNDSNHYITIIKGNTDYELIHGYSTKKKNNENDSFSEIDNDKKGITNYNSLTVNNNIIKQNKNKISIQDGYNDIILKKKSNIENIKQEEEKKFKEICTFKPTITSMSKKMFKNNVKVDLPKHRLNKSVNVYNSANIQGLNNNNFDNNKDSSQSKSPLYRSVIENNEKTIKIRKNKSCLQKMFKTNPLKDDKVFNERVQLLKSIKSNEINDDNYLITPMRFNIDYPSKFEGIGVSISRDYNLRQSFQNIIFYNIKVNDKIRTMRLVEGDDLKSNVINFVKKNKLPEEVVNIILNKIKEKEQEEKNE